MHKIDKKDKKIIYALCQNSRQPFSQITKQICLSKNEVAYRIERMKRIGLIKKFLTAVQFGFTKSENNCNYRQIQ
ncbi:AsnC family transcriptional regulator [Candidatus Woesearchaeota archaeon]|nr:AsnC family transcriptional regulator [Candidatus Woesearchaeota archaeon]